MTDFKEDFKWIRQVADTRWSAGFCSLSHLLRFFFTTSQPPILVAALSGNEIQTKSTKSQAGLQTLFLPSSSEAAAIHNSQRLLRHYSELAVESAVIVDGENNVAFLGIDDCKLVAFDLVIQRLRLVCHLNRGLTVFNGDGNRAAVNHVVDAIELAASGAADEREREDTDDYASDGIPKR